MSQGSIAVLDEELELNISDLHMLALLSRYETALMNNFNRTLQQLLVLQDRRRLQEEESMTLDLLPEPKKDAA